MEQKVKDVIVVSYATHRAGLLDEYEAQLAAAGIDFHLETVELQDGINSVTARWKFEFMRRMCERFAEYESIVFSDAWDVLFFGSKESLLSTFPEVIVVSAERNCWPEPELKDKIWGAWPWRYANAGLIAGSTRKIASVSANVLRFASDLDILEQAWMNRRLSKSMEFPLLDRTTGIFYTVSDGENSPLSRLSDGRIWNGLCNTFPQFFHFSGKCPTEPFRRMLEI